jgi:hypothetical protein
MIILIRYNKYSRTVLQVPGNCKHTGSAVPHDFNQKQRPASLMFLVNASSMFFNADSGLGLWYSVQLVVHVHCAWAVVFARETSALRGSERKRKRTSFYWTVVLIQICSILAAVLQGTPPLLQCLGGAKAKTNSRHFEVTLV